MNLIETRRRFRSLVKNKVSYDQFLAMRPSLLENYSNVHFKNGYIMEELCGEIRDISEGEKYYDEELRTFNIKAPVKLFSESKYYPKVKEDKKPSVSELYNTRTKKNAPENLRIKEIDGSVHPWLVDYSKID